MSIYYAKDGRKFLSETACKKYNFKLFENTNIEIFKLTANKELPIIFIQNRNIFYNFIEYLKYNYKEVDFNYFISSPELYIGNWVVIRNNYGKNIKLETLQEYKKTLLDKKKEIENIVKNISKINNIKNKKL